MTNSLQSQLDTGAQLLRAGRLGEAWQLAQNLLKQHRGNPAVHLYAADTASARGDRKGAIACLDDLPLESSGHPRVLLRKAQFLYNDSQREGAVTTARLAADAIEPDLWQLRTLARVLTDCHDLDGAHLWLTRALDLLPPNPLILYDLAAVEFQLNRADEAEQHIEQLLQLDSAHSAALQLRSALRTQTPESNHIADLQARLAAPQNVKQEVAASFALAKELEDLSHYAESFAALERGAGAHRGTLSYDSVEELASHEAIRGNFTSDKLENLAAGYEDESPIFVIGMPRTGTTLVERMLSSHSAVTSIGEFTDFPLLLGDLMAQTDPAALSVAELSLAIDFGELGKRYAVAARQQAGDSARFVDKLPYNFLYCGYLLTALPNARIVHLTRDPMDTCYAVYKTLFFNAYNFSYDLEELADYYISYRRQMAHWHQVFPGRILDVSYEQLVQEPETQAQRILQWCELPWEAGVLNFHQQDSPAMTASAMQVRKPMYTDSIGTAQRAGSGLDPLRERLQREGLI